MELDRQRCEHAVRRSLCPYCAPTPIPRGALCLECGRPEAEHTGGATDGAIACPPRPALEAPKAPSEPGAMPENAGKYPQTWNDVVLAPCVCGCPRLNHTVRYPGGLDIGCASCDCERYRPRFAGLDGLYTRHDGPRVPLEGVKPAEVPEIAGLYSAEPACDGCGGVPDRYWPSLVAGVLEHFPVCAECARVLA